MMRVQTVNHAVNGSLVVFKRDNTEDLRGKPKDGYRAEYVVIDVESLRPTVLEDPVALAAHIRKAELRIVEAEAVKRADDAEQAALLKAGGGANAQTLAEIAEQDDAA
jgi:hypothetical protein